MEDHLAYTIVFMVFAFFVLVLSTVFASMIMRHARKELMRAENGSQDGIQGGSCRVVHGEFMLSKEDCFRILEQYDELSKEENSSIWEDNLMESYIKLVASVIDLLRVYSTQTVIIGSGKDNDDKDPLRTVTS